LKKVSARSSSVISKAVRESVGKDFSRYGSMSRSKVLKDAGYWSDTKVLVTNKSFSDKIFAKVEKLKGGVLSDKEIYIDGVKQSIPTDYSSKPAIPFGVKESDKGIKILFFKYGTDDDSIVGFDSAYIDFFHCEYGDRMSIHPSGNNSAAVVKADGKVVGVIMPIRTNGKENIVTISKYNGKPTSPKDGKEKEAKSDLDKFLEGGHEPFEKTKEEWIRMQREHRKSLGQDEGNGNPNAPYSDYENYHEESVKRAIKEGKTVSTEVLKGYPALKPKDGVTLIKDKPGNKVWVVVHDGQKYRVNKTEHGWRIAYPDHRVALLGSKFAESPQEAISKSLGVSHNPSLVKATIYVNRNGLLKAKNMSKLTKKTIIDKNGHRKTVWVSPEERSPTKEKGNEQNTPAPQKGLVHSSVNKKQTVDPHTEKARRDKLNDLEDRAKSKKKEAESAHDSKKKARRKAIKSAIKNFIEAITDTMAKRHAADRVQEVMEEAGVNAQHSAREHKKEIASAKEAKEYTTRFKEEKNRQKDESKGGR